MAEMQAYLNNPQLKADLLIELGKHEAADALVKGQYGESGWTLPEGFKGCAIGCALHSLNALGGHGTTGEHSRFPDELGIPIELAYHIDTLFENLPDAESQTWPRRVLEAIQPGADLSGVVPGLLQWMLLDPTDGFVALARDDREREILTRFAARVARDWNGETATLEELDAFDRELNSIYVWARAWAWAGVWAGAGARARAWAGAWAGAWARARAGARAYSRLSAETLRLIEAAPRG